jgi:hypothetical protein
MGCLLATHFSFKEYIMGFITGFIMLLCVAMVFCHYVGWPKVKVDFSWHPKFPGQETDVVEENKVS